MAIVLEDAITAPVITFTNAQISATLPGGNPTAGEKVVVAVHIVNGGGLPAVSNWTKTSERIRTLNAPETIGFYYRDVVGGQETAARTFTLPAGTNVQSIVGMVCLSGAPAGAPSVTGGKIDQAGGYTGISGTSGTPANGGGFFFAAVGGNAANGGYAAGGGYPTNGFTLHAPTATTTPRALSLIKQNATATAQSTEMKWTNWVYPIGSIIGFVPAVAPTPANVPPIANAGPDQTVDQGDVVTFAGSGIDSDGTIAGYEWFPPFGITMSSTTVAAPTWNTASIPGGDYVFGLEVEDDDGATSPRDFVTISVVAPTPDPPVPGVTEVPQWVTVALTYTAPFNAAYRRIRLVRTGGSGTGTGGVDFPYTLPFVLGAAADSGDAGLVRKVFSGPGIDASFSIGGNIVTIERSTDGVNYEPVRAADGVTVPEGSLEVVDGEAVPDTPLYYRSYAKAITDGITRISERSEPVEVTHHPLTPFVKDPRRPEEAIALTAIDLGGESSSDMSTKHQPFGSRYPVKVSTGWTSSSGAVSAFVDNKEQRLALVGLLQSNRKLLLQIPSEDGDEEGNQWYFEPEGELGRARLTNVRNPARTVSFSWVEVSKP